MRERTKFFLVILISFFLLILALYLNSLAKQKLKILSFDSFDIVVEGRENILNPSVFYPGQKGYIIVNNLTGYSRDDAGKLNLVAVVSLYTEKDVLVQSQTKLLQQYSSVKEDTINKMRITFDINPRLTPGIYKLKIMITDSNSQQSVYKDKTLLVEGKIQ
ncbi:MAG: hypothetical protein QXR30_04235 [Candidatus Woesearchaeota archaeon]